MLTYSSAPAYVASSDRTREIWMRFGVKSDGSLDAGTVFFDATNHRGEGVPDGMKVDSAGNLYATGPGGVWFNTAAFVVPERYHYGNLGRNTLRGPSFTNWDFGVLKNFDVREGVRLQFRSEFFNAFNNTNFGNPNGNITNPNFGKVLGTVTIQRQIQFGLKLTY